MDLFFWTVASIELARPDVVRGSMMGHPCLRCDGVFYASCDRETGDLIVKLPASRVRDLIDTGTGIAFAPSGRTFREWVRVPIRDEVLWSALLSEAYGFATGEGDEGDSLEVA